MTSRLSLSQRVSRTSLIEGNEFDKELLYGCVLYTVAAGSEYWLLDWLKLNFGIELPVFFAIIQNVSWPLQGLYYLYEKRKYALEHDGVERVIDVQKYKSYAILGGLNAVVTLSRTIGITKLPPTTYAIIANTEIVFEGIMTRFYLQRKLRFYTILSIILVVLAVLVSLWNPKEGTYGVIKDQNAAEGQKNLIIGISVSLLSRLASSVNTILADRFLGRDRKTRIGVFECAFFNALIPCCLIPFALLFNDEYKLWTPELTGRNSLNTFTVTAVTTMICLAKWGDRISKFSVVQKASTMFFAVVDANMKFIAVVGTLLFFQQSVTVGQLIGFAFILGSLVCSLYDKKLKVEEEERQAQLEAGARESEMTSSTSASTHTLTKIPSFRDNGPVTAGVNETKTSDVGNVGKVGEGGKNPLHNA